MFILIVKKIIGDHVTGSYLYFILAYGSVAQVVAEIGYLLNFETHKPAGDDIGLDKAGTHNQHFAVLRECRICLIQEEIELDD